MNQAQEDRLPPEQDEVSLEDLFQDAVLKQAQRNPKRPKLTDPSIRNALDAAAKKMQELYTLPENWERTRGIALIEKSSQTLIGNFSEYTHKSVPKTRKLLREHTPISIDATEVVEGYLGEAMNMRLHGASWSEQHLATADLWLDQLMVGAPGVDVNICLHLGAIVRVELVADTQLSSVSGATILRLAAGTDLAWQLSTDTKAALSKAVRS